MSVQTDFVKNAQAFGSQVNIRGKENYFINTSRTEPHGSLNDVTPGTYNVSVRDIDKNGTTTFIPDSPALTFTVTIIPWTTTTEVLSSSQFLIETISMF